MAEVLSTGFQRAAKFSRVSVGGTFLAFASWDARVTGADLPTVNFESYNEADAEAYTEAIMGVLSCDASFGGAWDANRVPTATPPTLYPRDNVSSVQFRINRVDAPFWNFPLMRIRGVQNTAAVEALVLFNVSDAKNQGRFIRP